MRRILNRLDRGLKGANPNPDSTLQTRRRHAASPAHETKISKADTTPAATPGPAKPPEKEVVETEFWHRMQYRRHQWATGENPNPDPALQARRRYVASLVHKSKMYEYAQEFNLPLPERYADVATAEELDFGKLPEAVVIKPNNLANNECVMLFRNGIEIFSGDAVPVSERQEYVRATFAKSTKVNKQTRILAEELIQDYDPAYAVPRDFKVFVAGGKGHVIQVVDRVGPKAEWSHRYYNRDWVAYGDFQGSNRFGKEIPKPPHFDELMYYADKIAADIGCFMRLDFYITDTRVVFGEFTSYPNAGKRFTELGSAVMCDLMDRYPDTV